MTVPKIPRICLVPRLSGVGGMVSFQAKLAQGLLTRGMDVCYELDETPYDAVLVIGGTRHIKKLWDARKRGVRIVQRLDGMNWIHRVRTGNGALKTGLRHYIRSEYGNLILAIIRSRFTDRIVYQSEFSRTWWEDVRGQTPVPNCVIYNGVDLGVYNPDGSGQPPKDRIRVLMVEGSLMGGYEGGLETGIKFCQALAEKLNQSPVTRVELIVVGQVQPDIRNHCEERLAQGSKPSNILISWRGRVTPHQIPEIDRSAHVLYSSDVNAACPNSVIEALACGLPVLAFDTGALSEIVTSDSGRVVPYGGDVWRLDPPDIGALVDAAREIIDNQPRFRTAARKRAEAVYGLDEMVEGYLDQVLGD